MGPPQEPAKSGIQFKDFNCGKVIQLITENVQFGGHFGLVRVWCAEPIHKYALASTYFFNNKQILLKECVCDLCV